MSDFGGRSHPGAPADRAGWRGAVLVGVQFALLAAILFPWAAFVPGLASISSVLAGGALFAATVVVNRLGNFNIRPEPKATGRLIVSGPYRFVRHPMYVALLAVAAGAVASDAAPAKWAVWLALAGVLRLKATLEESLLERAYADYPAYRERTGAFLPRIG